MAYAAVNEAFRLAHQWSIDREVAMRRDRIEVLREKFERTSLSENEVACLFVEIASLRAAMAKDPQL